MAAVKIAESSGLSSCCSVVWERVHRHRAAAILAAILALCPMLVAAQAVHRESLGNGTELLVVAQPMADATAVSWPTVDLEGKTSIEVLTSGRLTLAADLEAALSTAEPRPAPPVIIAVGAAAATDLGRLLEALLAGRQLLSWPAEPSDFLVEGGLDRRLGSQGAQATLRLEVQMPAAADHRRAAVEVLWELLPELLNRQLPGLRARVDSDRASLELRVDAELAELRLSELRLGLARIAEHSDLVEDRVATAVRRVQVRRRANLEELEQAAPALVREWLDGGIAAVQQDLFGLAGVSLATTREAARQWLPQHPGHATLLLPPQVFNPRFSTHPESFRLENDLSVAVLERPASTLAALCLRPVLLPDVDGELSATVLARVAAELRSDRQPPAWVRVRLNPPQLELAGAADGFAELAEVLQRALTTIAADPLPAADAGGDARRRAMRLMGLELGLDETGALYPAALLRPDNLALGAVARDGEAAAEALRKFGVGGAAPERTTSSLAVSAAPRTREAASGRQSVLVLALEPPLGTSASTGSVAFALIGERLRALHPDLEIKMLAPLVPGRRIFLVVARIEGGLETLETALEEQWPKVVSAAVEEELVGLRRRVAADLSAASSGSLGRARLCAAVAAGVGPWTATAQEELAVLTTSAEELSAVLEGLGTWQNLRSTGAGILPIATTEP